MKTIIALLICTSIAVAQQTYEIPFASKDNVIELSVANNSALIAEGIKVEVTNAPSWLKFTEKTVNIASLKSKEESSASFNFSVEKTAEVKKEQTLTFNITDKNGQKWKKEITIIIMPPTTFELFQNYPNPFNPTTMIEYQLPGTVGTQYIVSLRIYDMLGREAANLINEQQEAGYHQAIFNAQRFASGIYIYRLLATDEENNRHTFQKKMIVLK